MPAVTNDATSEGPPPRRWRPSSSCHICRRAPENCVLDRLLARLSVTMRTEPMSRTTFSFVSWAWKSHSSMSVVSGLDVDGFRLCCAVRTPETGKLIDAAQPGIALRVAGSLVALRVADVDDVREALVEGVGGDELGVARFDWTKLSATLFLRRECVVEGAYSNMSPIRGRPCNGTGDRW